MFNKIMKRSHRKVAKSDVNFASAPPVFVVSHLSHGAAPPKRPIQQPSPAPPLGTIETLPMLRDVSVLERQSLFLRKLKVCCSQFDFSDTMQMVRENEIKRETLIELVDFIQSGSGKITEPNQEEMIHMISLNIFRSLPLASHENPGFEHMEPEEEDPYLDPSWPHLQLVYELLLRYVVSSDTDTKVAKRYINHSFVLKMLDLFDSEDPREREYLKTILHRIYGRFMVHRPVIRKAINNIFYRFIYETGRHNGIGELLEILGSIINGFALPMKEEHKVFLVRALIPLHKPKLLAMYHQQLSYCVTQFVEKDYKLADTVIMGLLKCWPVINSQKEVLFLGELEEVMEATQAVEFRACVVPLFRQIARSLNSSHFQVAERTLLLWNNEHIVGLISQNQNVILPIIFEALEKNIESHWNHAVHDLTVNVRRMFVEMDAGLFEECQRQYEEKAARTIEVRKYRELAWQRLEADVQ
ncbi:hypothetical protein CASFOL_009359 [Castilleja foliolosa]|uniref:Serine/threonine protein phosphatase 2A regulatory subunit n=1 Tax=Castilleja foliolosa TaxID=1961234 RepID=A0ABD3DX44_9LAMI